MALHAESYKPWAKIAAALTGTVFLLVTVAFLVMLGENIGGAFEEEAAVGAAMLILMVAPLALAAAGYLAVLGLGARRPVQPKPAATALGVFGLLVALAIVTLWVRVMFTDAPGSTIGEIAVPSLTLLAAGIAALVAVSVHRPQGTRALVGSALAVGGAALFWIGHATMPTGGLFDDIPFSGMDALVPGFAVFVGGNLWQLLALVAAAITVLVCALVPRNALAARSGGSVAAALLMVPLVQVFIEGFDEFGSVFDAEGTALVAGLMVAAAVYLALLAALATAAAIATAFLGILVPAGSPGPMAGTYRTPTPAAAGAAPAPPPAPRPAAALAPAALAPSSIAAPAAPAVAARPPAPAVATGTRLLKCPKCANAVSVAAGQKPVCGKCGFGAAPKAA